VLLELTRCESALHRLEFVIGLGVSTYKLKIDYPNHTQQQNFASNISINPGLRHMNRNLLVVGICYLLVSCSNIEAKHEVAIQKDTIKIEPKALSEKIPGTWTLVGQKKATIQIKKDKIYYPETITAYDYQITNDYIKVNYDGYVGAYQVEMKGEDTLVLKDEEEQTYLRVK